MSAAGPLLDCRYANRAGNLTKLCTLATAELSALTEAEWEKYATPEADGERGPPSHRGLFDLPWERAEGREDEGGGAPDGSTEEGEGQVV